MKLNAATTLPFLASSLLVRQASAALDVDLTSSDSIKQAAKLVAANLFTYYKGNQYGQTPGILPGPPPFGAYYWWEAGALWGTYIDYWHYTEDDTYSNVSMNSLLFQAGAPGNSFQPANVTMSLGNDDQGFWGMSAILAAETVFQNPPSSKPQWLALAQAVFNTQAAPDRHDGTCGGGLRWQIPFANTGYDYKNSIANGIFFNLGARLARYTGNDSYAQTATETWDWVQGVGLMSAEYDIYDGGHVEKNCTDISKAQFSYNAAVFLEGAAFMYNYTNGSDIWRERVEGLVNRTLDIFFPNGIAVELSCELAERVQCNTDMLSFKGFLHRWLATATKMAPFTHDTIMAVLRTSAAGAAQACDSSGVCGFRWTTGSFDNLTGAGQQMSALAALSTLLINEPWAIAPATNSSGGTSQGNSAAGTSSPTIETYRPLTTGDRAGASILTIVILASLVALYFWLSTDLSENSGNWWLELESTPLGAMLLRTKPKQDLTKQLSVASATSASTSAA
ncbi:putative dfg5 protein [Grosmannia clavigera kw1407]|uniref:Mannan endo-1,6-alpha-mannosidase n=1 Tax=Grosmannia clavigera (strain kw1407 / UAMH 11150) TaxID=655863 RepID=F0XCJ3_GROCL|nr:putative dfg5 protein [Grosmannia clavigera kw1407]EFX03582.1 putative dfg5 protein [Grosmannia clavigera kw1407]